MGDEILKKFGRYFLLDRIAQGGMAEIYRARLATPEGAGRILVIKRIQAGFNSNSDFLQMFKSEIKVTMGFNHPNIVQLYDFGEEQGMPYIAMEYVDGKNAKQFAQRFEKAGYKFPIELGAHIIEQAAAGLHYAHTYRDKITGQSLNVVHRDISPQNILVSFDGNVKVIDFGIAKATTNSEMTQAGVIKGKPSYLSPEQIAGLELDSRCDIFALGICLWELLVGRKLFVAPGENEYAVLKLIESCQSFVKPPSSFNSMVPKELDAIVMKALQKRREDRYQTAEDFQKALKKFLLVQFPEYSSSDLSYWAKNLFKDRIVEDRKELQRLNGRAEQLVALDLKGELETKTVEAAPLKKDREDPMSSPRSEVRTFEASDFDGEATPVDSKAKPADVERDPSSKTGRTIHLDRNTIEKIKRGIGSSVAATDPSLMQKTFTRTPISQPNILVNNKDARTHGTQSKLIRRPLPSRSNPILKVAAIGGVALVGVAAWFFTTGKHNQRDMPAVSNLTEQAPLAKAKVTNREISLKLNLLPNADDAKIFLNEKQVDPKTLTVRIKPDAPLELSIEKKNFRPLRREFVIQSSEVGELKEWVVDVNLEPISFGYLKLKSAPNADVNFYPYDPSTRVIANENKPWAVLKTPILNQKLPVGTYKVRLENRVLGMEKILNITIEEGRIASFEEQLEVVGK